MTRRIVLFAFPLQVCAIKCYNEFTNEVMMSAHGLHRQKSFQLGKLETLLFYPHKKSAKAMP